MIRTSQSVSISSALEVASVGNQSMARPIATPIAEAIAPIRNMRISGCLPPRSAGWSSIAAAAYGTKPMDGDAAGGGQLVQAAVVRTRRAAEAGRRRAVVAAERLGELSGLPVADAGGHVADRHRPVLQELEGALHADLGHVRAEARVADLGEGALQLAARSGEPACDLVELQVVRILAPNYLFRFLVERF